MNQKAQLSPRSAHSSPSPNVILFKTNDPDWCRRPLLTAIGGPFAHRHRGLWGACGRFPSKTRNVPELSWLFQMLWRPRSGPFKSLVIVCAPGEIEGQTLISPCPKCHLHNISFPPASPTGTAPCTQLGLWHRAALSECLGWGEGEGAGGVLLFDLGGFLRLAEEEAAAISKKKRQRNWNYD